LKLAIDSMQNYKLVTEIIHIICLLSCFRESMNFILVNLELV